MATSTLCPISVSKCHSSTEGLLEKLLLTGMVQNWRVSSGEFVARSKVTLKARDTRTSLEGAVCLAQRIMAASYEMPWVHDEGKDERGAKGVQTEHQGMPRKR